MRVRDHGSWIVALARTIVAVVACAHAVPARAGVAVNEPPRGFEEPAAEEARDRAERWAEAVGGRVTDVFATDDDDGYRETMAVIEVGRALSDSAVLDPERTLIEAFGDARASTDAPVTARTLVDDEGAPQVVTGRFEDDAGETWFVALASSGPTHTLVIMAVQSTEAMLYERGFDKAVAELEGIAPPLSPFSIGRWRIGVLGSWVAFGALAWMMVALLRGDDGVRERGRIVAVACAVAAGVAFAMAWFGLADSAAALALAGLGRGWVAAEAALVGVVAMVVVLAVAAIRTAQTRPIQSAPPGGAFGRLQQTPIRPTPPPREIIHARIDGPSSLAPADETTPPARPIETTVRSYPPPPPKPKPKP